MIYRLGACLIKYLIGHDGKIVGVTRKALETFGYVLVLGHSKSLVSHRKRLLCQSKHLVGNGEYFTRIL